MPAFWLRPKRSPEASDQHLVGSGKLSCGLRPGLHQSFQLRSPSREARCLARTLEWGVASCWSISVGRSVAEQDAKRFFVSSSHGGQCGATPRRGGGIASTTP